MKIQWKFNLRMCFCKKLQIIQIKSLIFIAFLILFILVNFNYFGVYTYLEFFVFNSIGQIQANENELSFQYSGRIVVRVEEKWFHIIQMIYIIFK